MKKKIVLTITACVLLLMGGLIYLCFRPPTLFLFKWLDFIGFNYFIFQNVHIKLPSFFIYNFTNALFVMFGYIFMCIIWDKDKYHYFLYTSLITFLSIIYEIITKDFSDIITIFITFIICSLLYIKNYWTNYEK
jgi:hypothetical protein